MYGPARSFWNALNPGDALRAVREKGDGSSGHVALARFFAETQVPLAGGLAMTITEGADSLLSVPIDRISA